MMMADKISKLPSYRAEHPGRNDGSVFMPMIPNAGLASPVMYRAAEYLRLSKEDLKGKGASSKSESNSISSQRALIEGHVSKCPDIEIVKEYVDDVVSGTSFDRPNFREMMKAVDRGEINCIIVKDLSRFGREYIDAGQLIEKYFPQKGIRFIAINDGFDSLTSKNPSDNLIIPFKNLINDSYSRDISVKVRSNLDVKRKRGEFIANFAVYGYMKDSQNKNALVIDEPAAQVVRDIFNGVIEGLSPAAIAKRLNDTGVLSPIAYKKANGSNYCTSFRTKRKALWSNVAVLRILTNEVYCGVLIQGRRTTVNYKVKKVIVKPEEEWCRIEGTHEPIIERRKFDLVQEILREGCNSASAKHPLIGRVFCGDCGAPAKRQVVMANGKQYAYYFCSNPSCEKRRLSEAALENAVLLTIQAQIAAILDVDRAVTEIDALAWEKRQLSRLNTQIASQEAEIQRNNELTVDAYTDFQSGTLSKEEFALIKQEYSIRAAEAQAVLKRLLLSRSELKEGKGEKQSWLAQFREYQNISALNRAAVVTLIDQVLLFPEKRIEVKFRNRDQLQEAMRFLSARQSQRSASLEEAI